MVNQIIIAWRIALNEISFKWAWRFLVFIFFIAFFSPFIANEKPLFIYDQQGIRFPVLHSLLNENAETTLTLNYKFNNGAFVILPLVPYSPGISDYQNADYRSPFDDQKKLNSKQEIESLPFRFRHWLGTDLRGADVLSGIINGAGVSLRIGFIATFLAFIVGLIIGGAAGWFKGNGMEISIGKLITYLIFILCCFQIYISIPQTVSAEKWFYLIMFFAILLLANRLGKFISKFYLFSTKINIPIDSYVRRFIEIFNSFPKLVIILIFSGFFKPSISLLIFLLIITGWSDFARIIRGEFIKISTLNYIDAAKLTGASNKRIILKHMLPNAIVPITVAFIYIFASFMLLEASLSFLGVGLPAQQVTWGSILASGKENLNAWWLILFPGLLLTLTITCFHKCAETIQKQFR